MRIQDNRLTASPTDLANFLACRHKTALDRLVAEGRLHKPTWVDPIAEVLRARGDEHERRYVARLRGEGLTIVDLNDVPHGERAARTFGAMRAGAHVIVQAALTDSQWLGYADVLRRVPVPSPKLGGWSYEAHDTKLTRETRGGTILQLCVYSELLGTIQGLTPERFHVVTPAAPEPYRFADFAAFYRQVRARFFEFLAPRAESERRSTYPDPVEHCGVCRWSSRCNKRRRADDHVTFVANLGRQQQLELAAQGITTLAALGTMSVPLPFRPVRGAKETYERLREQARLQLEARTTGRLVFDLLPIQPDFGLTQLPEPRPGDLFLDLEGDQFGRPTDGAAAGEGCREYLFGLGRVDADGAFQYTARWAFTDAEERAGFDAVMNDIMSALEADPAIHVYHYGSYEPAAFKRLMGRHAAREQDLDRLLRGRRFVDLYAIARHAVRAGVEKYSIKNLEPFYGFVRDVNLDDADAQRRLIETALELGDAASIESSTRAIVQGYNKDDCRSTLDLQRWLESLRDRQTATGSTIPRPPLEDAEPSEPVSARQARVNALRERLLDGVPVDASQRNADQQARYLLAYLLDWHYREDKVGWWEYFRLLELSDEELMDERKAVAGLVFDSGVCVVRHKKSGQPTGSVIDRYRYPPQDCDIDEGDVLKLRDGRTFGSVVGVDRVTRQLDVRKGPAVAAEHPSSAFVHDQVSPGAPAAALLRLGEAVASGGCAAAHPAAADVIFRQCRALTSPTSTGVRPASESDRAVQLITQNGDTSLPIQGPPGSGKTFTGAQMICALLRDGKRVGVTATSHKVIRNLLETVRDEAAKKGQRIRLGHKVRDDDDETEAGIEAFRDNGLAVAAIGTVDVFGGTAWLWSREKCAGVVDVLFVDEAGQMSLANTLAVSQAARRLVLLGDPQQLEQPQKGSHPDGVGVSALDHVLGGHRTMPVDRGLFLPITWRLAPSICHFTSEVFYEDKLEPLTGLEHQRLVGAGPFDGAGLFVVDVAHDGCRNASDEEVEAVAAIVEDLLGSDARWIDAQRETRRLGSEDILVVAPYNAQVSRLADRLAALGVDRVGTVDKFQGQQAPVVIYSMATSRPEDAPRGMEFLYSLNRLNVATSRARCVCILVASPRLFEPECRTPRQMRLANALARYREMALAQSPAGRPVHGGDARRSA